MNWLKSVSAAPANISDNVRFVVVFKDQQSRDE